MMMVCSRSFFVVVVVFSLHLTEPFFMIHPIFAVYDLVAQSISGPIMAFSAEPVAVRSFSDACLGAGSILASHPKDYHFVQLGTVDLTTGELTSLPTPRLVITAEAVLDIAERSQPQLPLLQESR